MWLRGSQSGKVEVEREKEEKEEEEGAEMERERERVRVSKQTNTMLESSPTPFPAGKVSLREAALTARQNPCCSSTNSTIINACLFLITPTLRLGVSPTAVNSHRDFIVCVSQVCDADFFLRLKETHV